MPLLAFAMYRLLRSVDREQARLMVAFALLCAAVSVSAEVYSFGTARLLEPGDQGAFAAAQVQSQAMALLEMRQSGVFIGQIFLSLWPLQAGVLAFRSGFVLRAGH